MNINVIERLSNFNEVGIYHNYTSKVMPAYTMKEAQFLESLIPTKKSKVLDVMCGYGRLANQLALDGYNNITGIDQENYSFLGVPKDFIFIKDNFLNHRFIDKYDFVYSLYNCYANLDDVSNILAKIYSVLNQTGSLVIDIFNKEWRDNIASDFYKELYIDSEYKLIIKRTYNVDTGNETTIYELYRNNNIRKEWEFSQHFFKLEDVIEVINNCKWDYEVYNSKSLVTRTNEQKNVMILRRK